MEYSELGQVSKEELLSASLQPMCTSSLVSPPVAFPPLRQCQIHCSIQSQSLKEPPPKLPQRSGASLGICLQVEKFTSVRQEGASDLLRYPQNHLIDDFPLLVLFQLLCQRYPLRCQPVSLAGQYRHRLRIVRRSGPVGRHDF